MLQDLLKNVKAANYSQAKRYACSLLGPKARIYRSNNQIQVGFDVKSLVRDDKGEVVKDALGNDKEVNQRYVLGVGPNYTDALKHMAMTIANAFAKVRAEEKMKGEVAREMVQEQQAAG